ncbi:MAG: hypothetical protein ACOYK1_01365 [Vampirovibrionia bacterium]
MNLLGAIGNRSFSVNKFTPGGIFGEVMQNGDNAIDGFMGSAKENGSNPYIKPKGAGGNLTDFLMAFCVGETFSSVDSIGGAVGTIAKSFFNPLDAITDLTSAGGVLLRGLAQGKLGIDTFVEAGGYLFSALPVIGGIADVAKLKGIFTEASKAGSVIADLNKGLDNAVDAATLGAKAAEKGKQALNLNEIVTDFSKLSSLDSWKDLKNVEIKMLKDGKATNTSLEEAVKLFDKNKDTELGNTITKTLENFNVGHKNKDFFSNIEPQTLLTQKQNSTQWESLKDKTIKVDGHEISINQALRYKNQGKLSPESFKSSLDEYNTLNKSKLSVEQIDQLHLSNKIWREREVQLSQSGINIQQGAVGKNNAFINTQTFSSSYNKEQSKMNLAGENLRKELQGIIKEKSNTLFTKAGEVSRTAKDLVVDPFVNGFKGNVLTAAA